MAPLWLLLLPLLLWLLSSGFRYYVKMGFYYSWIMALAVPVIPVCLRRGRDVENMKVVRSVLQHIKNLYGIKLEVKGLENLDAKGPYVIISNHQSSLDLMGGTTVEPDLPAGYNSSIPQNYNKSPLNIVLARISVIEYR
ncbi:hypothetical protein scyTo_0021361 [Scyliorhinus torazame]|uniref:1-acylglycerol-3-phosphate O-acyltransferase n=1 Tax=Scyliorhinus torazame TaxID=75743 RepID=A0A401Q7D7_SCYTO|nr:hypothetical protein [Scyliorhinus torazame]